LKPAAALGDAFITLSTLLLTFFYADWFLGNQGAVTMLGFASALANHNPYLGYHGDFSEGAASCYKAAGAFGILAAISAVSFVISAAL
jgi:hypothetical protein